MSIEGYNRRVPLRVHNLTVDANFLVVQGSSDSVLLNHRRGPVLLGCNVLQLLTDLEVDKEQTDSEAWRLILQWYRLTNMPSKGGQRANYKSLGSAFAARTGRNSSHGPE